MTAREQAGTRGDRMLMGRLAAAVDMIGRSGATEFEVAYDDETGYERVPVVWWATAKWKGQRVDSDWFPYPAQAAEDLLGRVLNGGRCAHCGRTTVVGLTTGDRELCNYVLRVGDLDDDQSYRYERSCLSRPVENRAARRRRGR